MYIGLHVEYPLLFSDFSKTWNFSKYFRKKKNTWTSNFMKICSMGVELMHTNGLTERQMDKHDQDKIRFLQDCELAKKLGLNILLTVHLSMIYFSLFPT